METLYVKTDGPVPDGVPITAGKAYPAKMGFWSARSKSAIVSICDDTGDEINPCVFIPTAHLHGGSFSFCDSTGTPVPAPWEKGRSPEEIMGFNHPDRKAAEQAYATSAFDYARDPVGSNNWMLFWQGWQCAAALKCCGNPEDCKETCAMRDYRAHAERLADAASAVAALSTAMNESANEAFERVAALFQRETGYVSPGKDCRIHDYGLRASVWEEWYQAKWQDLHAALSAYNQAKG